MKHFLYTDLKIMTDAGKSTENEGVMRFGLSVMMYRPSAALFHMFSVVRGYFGHPGVLEKQTKLLYVICSVISRMMGIFC